MTTLKQNKAYSFLLLCYAILPFVILNFRALDSGGPRFLALGILNLASLIVIIAQEKRRPELNKRKALASTWIGLFYLLFIAFSLMSFIKSINLNESLVYFTKLFTVLVSMHVLYVLISANKQYIKFIAVVLAILLLVDSIAVLVGISRYIHRALDAVSDIDFIYSNKNILASAIFIKLTAAVWLFYFQKSWYRILGYAAAFLGMLSTFLLSTRSFYLGLAALFISLLLFVAIRFIRAKEKAHLKPLIGYAIILVLSLGTFSWIQRDLFPSEQGVLNKDVVTRISTIADSNANHKRLETWGYTLELIKDNPLLGVGSGNWKIQILKYENPTLPDFKYMYRNHNDFLEIIAETGLLGGLSYLAVFFIIIFGFLRASINPKTEPEQLMLLALPAFGILAYSIDAFFNFPANRVELQLLFALFIASAASLSAKSIKRLNNKTSKNRLLFFGALLILSGSSLYILYQNYSSLKIQRLVKEDTLVNQFSEKTAKKVAKYPSIPDINCVGGPIVIDHVRYLINEQKLDEAKRLLDADKSSPYDNRKEYYLGMILAQQGQLDSALVSMEKLLQNKPLFQMGIDLYGTILYDSSKKAYQDKDYSKTLELSKKLLEIRPDYIQIKPIQAYCYFFTADYQNCLKLIVEIETSGQLTGDLVNLKSQCIQMLGN